MRGRCVVRRRINSDRHVSNLNHTDGMDLSRPLATLLPAADAGALSVLAATEAPLTGRRIAELAGERSHASTLRALTRLATQGIVHVQPAGRAKLYILNRSHMLTPAILEMTASTDAIRQRLSAAIEEWEVPCLHASIFGSSARGQTHSASDIDVLVVRQESLDSEEARIWDVQLSDLERSVFEWTGNPLSWFETTVGDLERALAAGESIFQSWRDEGIVVFGTPLASLLPSSTAE